MCKLPLRWVHILNVKCRLSLQVAHSGLISLMRLGVFLPPPPPPGWDASSLQEGGRWYPFVHLGGEAL